MFLIKARTRVSTINDADARVYQDNSHLLNETI